MNHYENFKKALKDMGAKTIEGDIKGKVEGVPYTRYIRVEGSDSYAYFYFNNGLYVDIDIMA